MSTIDAARIIGLMDLTSLNEDDTEEVVDALCDQAVTVKGPVAAVCVMPAFVAQAAERLEGTGVRIATVANFPDGDPDPDAAAREVAAAVDEGADEVDVVAPWRAALAGDYGAIGALVTACANECEALKVILETGSHPDPAKTRIMAEYALESGAAFLKSSTGKHGPGASLDAARILLEVGRPARRREGGRGHPHGRAGRRVRQARRRAAGRRCGRPDVPDRGVLPAGRAARAVTRRRRDPGVPKAELHVHLEGTAPAGAHPRAGRPQRRHAARRAVRRRGHLRLDRLPGLPARLRPRRERHPHRRGLPRRHLRVPDGLRGAGGDLRRADRLAGPRARRSACRGGAPRGHRAGHRRRACRPRHRGPDHRHCVRNFGSRPPSGPRAQAVELAHPYVVGFNMAGDEAGFPPGAVRPRLRDRRRGGAGLHGPRRRARGPRVGRATRSALPGVTRLSHGVRAIEDPALVARARRARDRARGLPDLERRARRVPGTTPRIRCARCATPGCRVTLGSDDPPYFGASIGGEYGVARERFGLDDAALRD